MNKGYDVTVFESLHKTGGVLVYGIPQFRLPKEIVAAEVAGLEAKGVKFVTDAIVGRAVTVDELMKEEGFESVFIGTGAGLPAFMNIPGENLLGVCSANEYLTRINLMKAYLPEYDTPIQSARNIAVVGGGNVAMDAARCAKRMGAENVYIIYRRSAEEIPARAEEIHHAVEEGIDFRYLTNPVAVKGNGGRPRMRYRMCKDAAGRAGCLRKKKTCGGQKFQLYSRCGLCYNGYRNEAEHPDSRYHRKSSG